MRDILLVAIGSAIGGAGRYLVNIWAYQLLGPAFPYGTLIVNVLGSFVLGFVMQLSLLTDLIPTELRLSLAVGFFGAFTTFSTFAFETVSAFETGNWTKAWLNVLLNVVICLLVALAGMRAARLLEGVMS